MVLKIGRGGDVPPFLVMDIVAAANARQAQRSAQMRHVIRMEVGQPGTGAPRGAVEAAQRALNSHAPLGYTDAFGVMSLRERIGQHIQDWYGHHVPTHRVAVTNAASGAFMLAFLAAFNTGDRIALAAPYYPPYVNALVSLGLQPVVLETGPETRFQPTPELLDRLDPCPEGLIIASPSNPAGSMLSPDELAALARWCDSRGVRLISDEIYHGLQYEKSLATASAFSPNAIVINSFSKYFSMTGWRVGWMVLPEDLVLAAERLAQNLFISTPHISQIAAQAAFDCHEELQDNIARYRRSRVHLLAQLPRCGFTHLCPAEGAFYIYADVSDLTDNSVELAAHILDAADIAVTPGVDFDRVHGARHLRFSFCGPEQDMVEATQRLAELKLVERKR